MKCSLALATILTVTAMPTWAIKSSDLDKPLAKFEPYRGSDFIGVCRALKCGCGIEIAPDDTQAADSFPSSRKNRTARQILDAYVKRKPSLIWSLEDGAINLKPAITPQPDWLSKPAGNLSFHAATGFRASLSALRRTGAPLSYQIMGRPPIFKPLDLELNDVTARQALNAFSNADGEFIWVVAHPKPDQIQNLNFLVISWRNEGIGITDDERKEIQKLFK